jgi:hypothetical protein
LQPVTTVLKRARAILPALALASSLLFPASGGSATSRSYVVPGDELVKQTDRYRLTTWRWQRVMGERLARSSLSYRTDPSRRYKRWARNLWRQRAISAHRRAVNPPNYSAWLCIHRYEASWTDGGGPYYGGLQMDVGFQLRYGRALYLRKGTADHWTPLEQIWTAERARASGRGFWPWPNTARLCGVL